MNHLPIIVMQILLVGTRTSKLCPMMPIILLADMFIGMIRKTESLFSLYARVITAKLMTTIVFS